MGIKTIFSDQEQEVILALRKKRVSIHDIALKLHRSRRNISLFVNYPEKYKQVTASLAVDLKKASTPKKRSVSEASTASTPKKAINSVKFSKTATSSIKKLTPKDLAEYSKVIVEHRCVIKFLAKRGETNRAIYSQLKKVYQPLNPDMPAVRYWANQFKQGRETIINDTKTAQKISLFKSPQSKAVLHGNKQTAANGVKSQKKKEVTSENPKKKPAVEAKKPLKRLSDGPRLFQIKLPGMDRLKKLSR